MILPVRPRYSRDRVSRAGPPVPGTSNLLEVFMQAAVLSVFGVCLLFTIFMHLYRARLTRDEEDQIFLDDSFSHERSNQAAIAARVLKIEPMVKASVWLAGAATVLVISYYIWDIFN